MTGMGKTVALRKLIEVPGQLVLIHDVSKSHPEFPTERYFRTVADLLEQPADEVSSLGVVAFRGDPYAGITCEVEEVAELALRAARARVPVRLVIDELDRAVSDGGRKLEAPSLREAFVIGRSIGLSVVANVQQPQRMPEIATQASSLGIFRLEPAAVSYIADRFGVAPELAELVPTLAVGEFVLYVSGAPWDRTVYRFPAPGL